MYNRFFILLIQVGYLGIDVRPTSLPQWSTLLFLLIFIMYKYITPNTSYHYSYTFSLMIYNFSIMHTAWCLTLYHNPIYCWALSIYNILIYYQYHSNIVIHYCHTKHCITFHLAYPAFNLSIPPPSDSQPHLCSATCSRCMFRTYLATHAHHYL